MLRTRTFGQSFCGIAIVCVCGERLEADTRRRTAVAIAFNICDVYIKNIIFSARAKRVQCWVLRAEILTSVVYILYFA